MRRQPKSPKPRVRPRLSPELAAPKLPHDDLIDEAQLTRVVFDDVDFGKRAARLIDIEECRLTRCRLPGSSLDKLTLSDSEVDSCDLANVELSHNTLSRVEITSSRLTGLAVAGAVWRHVLVKDCLADLSAFRFTTFTRVEFVDCRLHAADFEGADLTGAVFRGCDLTRAELSQVKASRAVFIDCIWNGIRGVTSLAGATVANRSPVDAVAFTDALARTLGITIADPDDFGHA
jgi:uncharacterized protein YjbI with pentapeptide repeats